MKKIILPKGAGKTQQLIKMSAETGDYIVCQYVSQVTSISDMAKNLNLIIPQPITYGEFINGSYSGHGIKGFLIDNADMLIQYMTRVPVNALTIRE